MPQFNLMDYQGYNHVLESNDLETIARWFAEWAPHIVSADSRMPEWRVRAYPTGQPGEGKEWTGWSQQQIEYMIGRNADGRIRFIHDMMDAFKVDIVNGELHARET